MHICDHHIIISKKENWSKLKLKFIGGQKLIGGGGGTEIDRGGQKWTSTLTYTPNPNPNANSYLNLYPRPYPNPYPNHTLTHTLTPRP